MLSELFQGQGSIAFECLCNWVNANPDAFQCRYAEKRFNGIRPKDNFRHCVRTHERQSGEAIVVFDRCAVGQFVGFTAFRLNSRFAQLRCWRQTNYSAGVHKKRGSVRRLGSLEIAYRNGDVRVTHRGVEASTPRVICQFGLRTAKVLRWSSLEIPTPSG